MWVKVTDPFSAAPQWVNLDTVSAIKRVHVQSQSNLATGELLKDRDVTRLFCAPGTIDCAELPEQILACAPDAVRHVVPKTVPPVAKRKGAR